MRAVVTGGAGFIGSYLVDRLLAEGHHVDAIDDLSTGSLARLGDARSARGAFRFHQLDVRAPELAELFERLGPEVVFHLADASSIAASLADARRDLDGSLGASLAVLDATRRSGARKLVVAASAAALYASASHERTELPFTERLTGLPASPHGLSTKALLEYLSFARTHDGLEFSALALATVYGPRQLASRSAGAVVAFARQAVAGRPLVVHGDGAQTRDFVYVDDVVDAFSRASERGSGLLVNIGTGVETSIAALARLVEREAATTIASTAGPAREGDAPRVALDAGRAAIHLGWRSWTSLEDGVRAVLEAARGSAGPDDTSAEHAVGEHVGAPRR